MSTALKTAKRYGIQEARLERSESIYVFNRAPRIMRKTTNVLLPHTSRDSGDTASIDIPMSSNPIDLSLYVPKDELLRNREFLNLVQRGILELVSEEDAKTILESEDGRAETERLTADYMRKMSNGVEPQKDDPGAFRTSIPPEAMAGNRAPGEVDPSLLGVSGAVVNVMNDAALNDAGKATMLRTLASNGILSDADKRYIRSNTADPAIRNLAAE